MAKNISKKHNLEEYKKKYHNGNYRLLKLSKKELKNFDTIHGSKSKDYLINSRNWWLIGDTYYEVPKAPRLLWFRNLGFAAQASICLLGAGVVATAVTVPTYMLLNRKTKEEEEESFDPTIDFETADKDTTDVTFVKKTDDGIIYESKLKSTYEGSITGIKKVMVGNYTLTVNDDYKEVDESNGGGYKLNIIVYSKVFKEHKGKVVIYHDISTTPYWSDYLTFESLGTTEDEIVVSMSKKATVPSDLIIPSFAKNKSGKIFKVTAIGSSAFTKCTSIKSLVVPDSVRFIGESAFEGCTNLESITLGSSLIKIGTRAFVRAGYNLKTSYELVIPSNVTEIGQYAFGEAKLNKVKFTNINYWSVVESEDILSPTIMKDEEKCAALLIDPETRSPWFERGLTKNNTTLKTKFIETYTECFKSYIAATTTYNISDIMINSEALTSIKYALKAPRECYVTTDTLTDGVSIAGGKTHDPEYINELFTTQFSKLDIHIEINDNNLGFIILVPTSGFVVYSNIFNYYGYITYALDTVGTTTNSIALNITYSKDPA